MEKAHRGCGALNRGLQNLECSRKGTPPQAEKIAAKGGDRLPQATKKGGIAAERSRGAAKGFKFVGWKLLLR